jgi:hypothetical protein
MQDTTNIKVPAHIAAKIEANKKAGIKSSIASALAGSVNIPRISKKSSRFRLNSGGIETVIGMELDIIIVGSNPFTSKIYYDKDYEDDSEESQAPRCLSSNGRKPDAEVEEPIAESCLTCANNVLGSKITPKGAKSKICSDVRYLAVVPASDPTQVYQMQISVTEMKGLREYISLLNNYGIPPEYVITKLTFDDKASYPRVIFNRSGFVPEKAMDAITKLQDTDDVKIATKEIPHPDAMPIGAMQKQAIANVTPIEKAKPKPKPEPIAVTDAEAVAVEPSVKPAKAPKDDKQNQELESELDNLFGT